MNPFDFLKSLFTKEKLEYPNSDDGFCIFMNKWLSFHPPTSKIIKNILPYLFFIDSEHYLKLLYFAIPPTFKPPYIKKPQVIEQKESSELLLKTQYILGWTNKEIKRSAVILNNILKNEKYWKTELGVK